ncbi:MAG: GNAT family N-acetyltransferase [Clostridia bacterium]
MDNIKFEDNISLDDYLMLRKSADFKELSIRQAELAIKNHNFLIVAKDNEQTVGMARLLGDDSWVSTIVDVIVLPKYQSKGIGRVMIEKILEHINSSKSDDEQVLVMLLAAKGKEGFYEKLGFAELPNDTSGAGMLQWLLNKPTK